MIFCIGFVLETYEIAFSNPDFYVPPEISRPAWRHVPDMDDASQDFQALKIFKKKTPDADMHEDTPIQQDKGHLAGLVAIRLAELNNRCRHLFPIALFHSRY